MNIQKNIVRLMTFKSYLEHTEPIFKELSMLDAFRNNDYLTTMHLCYGITVLKIYLKNLINFL